MLNYKNIDFKDDFTSWYMYGSKDLVTEGINTFRANVAELFLEQFSTNEIAKKHLDYFWGELDIDYIRTKERFCDEFWYRFCPILAESKWFSGDKYDSECYPCEREIFNDNVKGLPFSEAKEVASLWQSIQKQYDNRTLDDILEIILHDYYKYMGCLPSEKKLKKYGVVESRLIDLESVENRYKKYDRV